MVQNVDRLLGAVEFDTNGGCWLWSGSTAKGYGKLRVGERRSALAHRLSWELYRGPIPLGFSVCHQCDVPECINPDHLWIGTRSQNTADMIAKKRGSFATTIRRLHKAEAELAEARAEIERLKGGSDGL